MTSLRLKRGTTSQNNTYTGPPGELTMDTTVNQLRLHDGTTVGGVAVGSLTVTSVKTSAYNANVNELVRIDSTAGGFTIVLPASPNDGTKIAFLDIANKCGTNPVLVSANGKTILGDSTGINLDANGAGLSLIFNNLTNDWNKIDMFGGRLTIPPVGEQLYTTPGTYNWLVPAGVTSVCVVCVGGGAFSGAGGALHWANDLPVIPGTTCGIIVGAGGIGTDQVSANGGTSAFYAGVNALSATGGTYYGNGTAGGIPLVISGTFSHGGGAGGSLSWQSGMAGGGGAGGYTGPGGAGGGNSGTGFPGSSGGGGGGNGCDGNYTFGAGGGGGVGLYGQGNSGAGGTAMSGSSPRSSDGGQGGSGGGAGGWSNTNGRMPDNTFAGVAGVYVAPYHGGGGGGGYGGGGGGGVNGNGADGGTGAVRIIWGSGRSFPLNAA
jgi:hypothetical protein